MTILPSLFILTTGHMFICIDAGLLFCFSRLRRAERIPKRRARRLPRRRKDQEAKPRRRQVTSLEIYTSSLPWDYSLNNPRVVSCVFSMGNNHNGWTNCVAYYNPFWYYTSSALSIMFIVVLLTALSSSDFLGLPLGLWCKRIPCSQKNMKTAQLSAKTCFLLTGYMTDAVFFSIAGIKEFSVICCDIIHIHSIKDMKQKVNHHNFHGLMKFIINLMLMFIDVHAYILLLEWFTSVYLQKWSKGKVRDKLNNLVLFDKATYDKLYKEVPAYKLITPSVVSERLKIRGSLARRALSELHSKSESINDTWLKLLYEEKLSGSVQHCSTEDCIPVYR